MSLRDRGVLERFGAKRSGCLIAHYERPGRWPEDLVRRIIVQEEADEFYDSNPELQLLGCSLRGWLLAKDERPGRGLKCFTILEKVGIGTTITPGGCLAVRDEKPYMRYVRFGSWWNPELHVSRRYPEGVIQVSGERAGRQQEFWEMQNLANGTYRLAISQGILYITGERKQSM
jgi:hypothetical protein